MAISSQDLTFDFCCSIIVNKLTQRSIMKTYIKGFEGIYSISKEGTVINELRGNIKKPTKMKIGYLMVDLYKENKATKAYLHRLIAEHFIPNDDPINKTQVNHINGNKLDNSISNLEWVTQRAAMQKANKAMKDKVKPVYKIDIKTGKVVDQYDSPQEAADDNFVSRKCITMALSGKLHTSAGYKWTRG